MRGLRIAGLALLSGLLGASALAADPPDPDKTTEALRALFAAANDTIPAKTSCDGIYGQKGPAKVRDLLAMQMAYLHNGDNVVGGECKDGRCEVFIKHSAGESVASAQIRFAVNKGKASARSLECIITP